MSDVNVVSWIAFEKAAEELIELSRGNPEAEGCAWELEYAIRAINTQAGADLVETYLMGWLDQNRDATSDELLLEGQAHVRAAFDDDYAADYLVAAFTKVDEVRLKRERKKRKLVPPCVHVRYE